ncbi:MULTISPECIES: alanyl-tRNA editing protein [Acidiplasma]|jgi:alanyl-tRNA synthetase/misacylated tRNA(Ala) deacylase|uniref:alanyl-tRNA editing protein n=1 Tax=Acidiplasma TaxID=507753 RepID=UPI0005E61C95|nr:MULTISPECIES: alanyl-tRNA editing protein [unclassified Acidiplasma]KJE49420.1 alanyl-tRNA synthetase [Acidiplasma sp. MBA-1]WMT54614.1 MAG: alanyl-tRNA editing protein [Acidiplasma sp.]
METEKLFLKDSYLKECDSKAVTVEFTDLTVDKTVFYPTSYGQQNDKGEIEIEGKKYSIVDVWEDGQLVHLISLDTYPQNLDGVNIHQSIDWNIRYNHMRYRTALFIIGGLAFKFYNAKSRISQTYENYAWIDIYIDNIKQDIIDRLIDETNRIIKQNLPVEIKYADNNEFSIDKQMFGFSTGSIPQDEKLRVVNISGLPLQADYGLHVKSTGEIGTVEFKTSMVKGKLDKRLTITLK